MSLARAWHLWIAVPLAWGVSIGAPPNLKQMAEDILMSSVSGQKRLYLSQKTVRADYSKQPHAEPSGLLS